MENCMIPEESNESYEASSALQEDRLREAAAGLPAVDVVPADLDEGMEAF